MTTEVYEYHRNHYEWDAAKAEQNYIKHGISFVEAASAFENVHAFLFDDPDHSIGERREILTGYTAQNRCITVIFTERKHQQHPIIIRIISARLATKPERKRYEEAIF